MRANEALLVGGVVVLLVLGAHTALSTKPDQADPPGTNGTPPHPVEACSDPYHVHGAGWDVCWQREDVRVQGLEINRAFFENESVVWKMGVPFSLTEYDDADANYGPFKDVLGTPVGAGVPGYGRGSMEINEDACPRFQTEGELLDDGRVCVEHTGGVSPEMSLWARYDVFNYRFLQGWHFNDRGEVDPFVALGGQLLDGATAGASGAEHYHHIYWRVDLDVASPGGDRFQAFKHLTDDASATAPSGSEAFPCTSSEASSTTDLARGTWCNLEREAKLTYHQETHDKWRVVDPTDTNGLGRAKSFEFVVRSAAPADDFSTFDAMVLEHKGDNEEIGYEVSSSPSDDGALDDYKMPPEEPGDPVAWVVNHVYHETRDEERGSMVYHHAGFTMHPRNLLDENPSESTFP